MAVLVEGISVIVRADTILSSFLGGWDGFKRSVPNKTLCADGELVRVGFMHPEDVESWITALRRVGLRFIEDDSAMDIVVADQLRGFTCRCEWAEFGHIDLGGAPDRRVVCCRLVGSQSMQVVMPEGWNFETSLTRQYTFVAAKIAPYLMEKTDGDPHRIEQYRDVTTGQTHFMGRTGPVEIQQFDADEDEE